MVSMRKFRELGAATGDAIEPVKPVDTTPRPLESAVQRDLLEGSEVVDW